MTYDKEKSIQAVWSCKVNAAGIGGFEAGYQDHNKGKYSTESLSAKSEMDILVPPKWHMTK